MIKKGLKSLIIFDYFLRNKLAKETFWSFVSKSYTFLLYFALNVVLARKLGIEQYGLWSFFFSTFTIILLFSHAGINASIKKFVAQYKDEAALRKVLKNGFKLRLILSLLFCILVAILHQLIANSIGKPELANLFLYSSPLIFIAGIAEFLKDVFIGLHRIKYNFIINFLEMTFKLLFVFLFSLFSLNLINIVNSFNLAFLIASLVGLIFLYKHFYQKLPFVDTKSFTKEIFLYSLPLFFISIGFLIATEIDTFMLGLLSTNTEVGTFAIAKQIIVKLPHISVAISMGTMPIFAKINKENQERLKILFYKLLKINALIFFSLAIGILFLAPFFIPFFFGKQYLPSILPMQILTVYLISFSFSVFLSSFLDYIGQAKKRAVNLSFSVILNILLNIALIPKFGGAGAAIATSVSYLPYVVLNWLEVKKALETKTQEAKKTAPGY